MVGLPHKVGMKPLDLSAGEQQRIAIARALINEPAIVLADEPTGNLDSVNSSLILDLFRDLNRRLGQTIMMITHNPEAAAVGDRTIEMKDGRVVSRGLADLLRDAP
jgi:putative ABC transport system ATP-binding protein